MTDTINGRTPEEIKLRLACIFAQDSGWCENQESCEKCEYNVSVIYTEEEAARDALAYIQQLEARIDTLTAKAVLFDEAVAAGERYKRERDAAVQDMYHAASDGGSFCDICKYNGEPCDKRKIEEIECWKWRGAHEEV